MKYRMQMKDVAGKLGTMIWYDSPDAFVWQGVRLPVKVLYEYPKYLVVEVLPHRNPNFCYGPSRPYRVAVSKWAAHNNEIYLDLDMRSGRKKEAAG